MPSTQSTASARTRRGVLETIAGLITVGGTSGVVGADRFGAPGRRRQDEGTGCDFSDVADDALDSVVTLRVFDGQEAELVEGSGWVYSMDDSSAEILTNWHVVFLAAGADVRFHEGDWRAVDEPLGFDPYSDLAALRVDDVPEYVEPFSLVDELPDQGDAVAALGAPLGLERTVTTGTVSATQRSPTIQFEQFMYTVPSAIQTDAATNPGNSGGPLVDCNGDVVGVNFAGAPPLVAENINFAISATMVSRIAPEIIDGEIFRYPYMGIQALTISPTISRANDVDETTQGVLVEQTVEGYPADEVLEGSTATDRVSGAPIGGDVILAADGTDVADTDELRSYLFEETRPDDTITLSIVRDGDEREVELTLAAKPLELERIGLREPTM